MPETGMGSFSKKEGAGGGVGRADGARVYRAGRVLEEEAAVPGRGDREGVRGGGLGGGVALNLSRRRIME